MTHLKLGSILFIGFYLLMSCSKEKNILKGTDSELQNLIQNASPTGDLSYFILPESSNFSAIPQDPKNPISKEKIALGGFLFHETGLGVGGSDLLARKTYSCASCHHAAAGFQSGTYQGIGDGGLGFGTKGELRRPMMGFADADVQSLKTPSVLNAAYQPNQLWNGQAGATYLNSATKPLWKEGSDLAMNHLGYEGIETQAIQGMALHRLNVDDHIKRLPAYKKLFDEAFPGKSIEKRYANETAGLAIAAYLRTLLSTEAPFQKYLKGDLNALTETEKSGAILFFGKAHCNSCHTGPALNSMQFNAIGLGDLADYPAPTLKTSQNDPANLGRGGFTQNQEEYYAFKVPQLYNLLAVGFYGHGSSKHSVKDMIMYKNTAIAENKNVPRSLLDPLFRPLGLTDKEIDALTTFIEKSLYDPNLRRYEPQLLPSGLCFPNADVQSRIDMDCF
jgi:cytochrome c peroxidase